MRFEITEVIKCNISENEMNELVKSKFKQIAESVRESENPKRITVENIEASFGSINKADTTTVRVKPISDGYECTAIIDYRPSGWMWFFVVIGLFIYILPGLIAPIFFFYYKSAVRDDVRAVFDNLKVSLSTSTELQATPQRILTSVDEIAKLHDLLKSGALTQEEFNDQKKRLLKTG